MPTDQLKWLSQAAQPHMCTLGEKSTILRPHTDTGQNSLIKAVYLISLKENPKNKKQITQCGRGCVGRGRKDD